MFNFEVEGKSPQIDDFSVQVDVVSVDPSDTSAGVGGASFALPLHNSGLKDLWNFLYGSTATLDAFGATSRTKILDINLDDVDQLTIAGESPLRSLQASILVPAFQGNVRTALIHIVRAISPIPITFHPDVPSTSTVVPALHGNVWVFLRDYLVVHRLELVLSNSSEVFVRPMGSSGTVYSPEDTFTAQGINVSGETTAEYVEINYYNNRWVSNATVYPVTGEEPSVISVNAGETAVIELSTLTGMNSVTQPVPLDWIDDGFTGSGYTIAGSDGLPVRATSWVAAGGMVRAEIKPDDPYTIVLTVTAPTDGVLATPDDNNTAAPYHLAMTDGELYPRLFITGTGVQTDPQTIEIYTGADDELVEPGVGFTLENPHVGSLGQAYDAGIRVAQAYSGASTTVSRTSPEYSDFQSAPGAIYETPDSNYRVESVSYSPTGASFTAKDHSTFDDFNDVWQHRPHTFNDFNAYWAAQPKSRFRDFAIAPLR